MSRNAFAENSKLKFFLPMIYVAWSDSVLTKEEISEMNSIIDQQAWLTESDKIELGTYLNAERPPSPSELKDWWRIIRSEFDESDINEKLTLVELSLRIASLGEPSSTEVKTHALKAVTQLEKVLGLGPSENSRFIKSGDETQAESLSSKNTFDIPKMTTFLDDDQTELINEVKNTLCSPDFEYFTENSTDEYRDRVLAWCQLLADKGYGGMSYPKDCGGQDDMRGYFTVMETLSYHDLSLVVKFGVQFGLFGMSVMFLGTKSHHQKYLKSIGSLDLPGGFAMTETGHGSNVKNIQTTATYDHASREFIIHTPTELDRKDYIGNAARHAQMVTVFAKLIIDGVDYGVNAFLVPIRNEKREVLPGIRIEDCGHKMGLNGVDNGRIWFDQVRIPKENMLDRFASVSETGEFESPIASDNRRFFTMLGTLVGGRVGIPRSALSASKSGLTIAIKYGNRRRQFGPENRPEVPILNYRTHQRRLMPLLANAYALHFALQHLTDRFLNRSETDIQEIEALAAGLKSYATWNNTETLQICREACGGQGFLSENRIGILKNDSDIYTTFEGDNTVLMQLVAKGRLTEFKKEFHDINLFGILNYVTDQAKTAITEMNPLIIRNTDEQHLLDPDFHLNAFKYRERDILTSAAKRLKKHLDSGMDAFDAFNQCQYHMLNVGKAYAELVVLEQFQCKIEQLEASNEKNVLTKLCSLYALSQIEKNKGWYLEHGYLEGVKTKAIRKLVNKLCLEIRQEAVPLVESFAIPGKLLAAPIAVH